MKGTKLYWDNFFVSDINSRINFETVLNEREYSKKLLESKRQILSFFSGVESASISRFDVPGINFFSSTSELMMGKETFFGHGRSDDPIVAASKAFGENIERILAFKFMNDLNQCRFESNFVRLKNGKTVIGSKILSSVPPKSVQSSNGWALHFSAQRAVFGAVAEAAERTILQALFIANGWRFFECQFAHTLQERKVSYWLSKVDLFGFYAGIVESTLHHLLGRTYGYFLIEKERKFVWEELLHSAFEAIEPAIFFDANPNYGPAKNDSIGHLQFEFAKGKNLEGFPEVGCHLQLPAALEAELILLDVAKLIGLEFPLYLAWVFGGNSVPLIFRSRLDDEGRAFINKRLHTYGISYSADYDLPII